METLHEFGIVYLLPNAAAKYHRELRLKIEEEFRLTGSTQSNVPSHITMKYRFNTENIEEVKNILQEFANSQVKTKWLLKGFNHFVNTDSFVIFIDVVPSPETREAHAQFLDALRRLDWMQWSPFDNANLHYHVTLAHKGITAENFETIWTFVIQQEPPDFELFFDNFALLKISDGIHSVYKEYRLLNDQTG